MMLLIPNKCYKSNLIKFPYDSFQKLQYLKNYANYWLLRGGGGGSARNLVREPIVHAREKNSKKTN